MLPVLKKAGVVDAGGQGLLFIFTGMYNILAGIEMKPVESVATATVEAPKQVFLKPMCIISKILNSAIAPNSLS